MGRVKEGDKVRIYMDQVPEEVSFEDYPAGTEFVFDESPIRRYPVTHKLIPREKRPLIYPKDIKN